MTKQEAIKTLQRVTGVYAWVDLTEHDGQYLKISKKETLLQFNNLDDGLDIKCRLGVDVGGTDALFIN